MMSRGASLRAEKALFEKSVLFEAGHGGYETYRIPCLAATAQGTLLAVCEARRSARGDWGAIDLLMRRSPDGGRTWEAPRNIGTLPQRVPKNPVALAQGLVPDTEQTHNNPVLIADPERGATHFLHCVEYAHCFYRRSEDEGQSWSAPVDITPAFEAFRPDYDWRVLATGPGHGLRMRNGRLVVPVWLSTGTGGHAHRPSCVSVIFSDDEGRTWQRGEVAARQSAEIRNPSETVAVQLSDGRVMLNIRSEAHRHRRLLSFSEDGATGWSEPVFDEALFEPVCCAGLIALPGAPSSLLFSNPDSHASTRGGNDWDAWPRENLTLRLSEDDGRTWPITRVVDPGVAGYSDLAVGPDGTLSLLYEGGAVEGSMFHTAAMSVVRANLAWLRGE